MRRAVLLLLVLALSAPAAAPAVAARPKAPDIGGTTLNGKKLSLAWFRGKPVFLNVWASW